MGIGLALLGMAIGAAGVEILRTKKPEMINKVENAAKKFVESIFPQAAKSNAEDDAENNVESNADNSAENDTEDETKD